MSKLLLNQNEVILFYPLSPTLSRRERELTNSGDF
jgi:hypothetical protein